MSMGQTTDCDEDVLLVREACAMLRMSPQTFRLYEKAGHIKVTKGPHRHSELSEMCQWAPCRECEHTGFNAWNESCLTCECGDRVNELSLCGVCREPVGEGEWTRHDSRNRADHPGALAPQESMTTNEHKEKQ